jgi:predicted RND superfamily exporter protein
MVALWTTEAMGLLNISFNLANFFSVPILIGLSVNGSVYVLHRYREGGPTRFNLGATRRAVILTALNTLIGFGALMAARHRGLRSLGEVMAIGSTACLIASVIVLPAILAWLESLRPPGRRDPT